jgi:hypothetical protein
MGVTRTNHNQYEFPEQNNAKHEINDETRHIEHCTLTTGIANVLVQNIFHARNNITGSVTCKYRTAATFNIL